MMFERNVEITDPGMILNPPGKGLYSTRLPGNLLVCTP